MVSIERLHVSFCHGNDDHFGAQPLQIFIVHQNGHLAVAIKLLLCYDTIRKRSILTLVYTKSRYVSGNEAISSDHPFTRLQANKSAKYCVPSPSQGAHASVSISTAMAACCSICMFI